MLESTMGAIPISIPILAPSPAAEKTVVVQPSSASSMIPWVLLAVVAGAGATYFFTRKK